MIALDVETTGMDPRACSILSLGALDLDEPNNQFYGECCIWEDAQVNDEALAINGFSHEEISREGKDSEAELIKAFVAWACDRPKNRMLTAQNVSFDHDFVQAACKRAGIEFPFAKRTIDIHTLAWLHATLRGTLPLTEKFHSALNSKTILTYCGLPEEPRPHNALTGALWHAEVVSRMAYNKNLLPEFSTYTIPWVTT